MYVLRFQECDKCVYSNLCDFFRFFEAKVEYEYALDPATNETVNYTVIGPLPTDLRTHPIYTAYFNWSRLIVLGIIPFVLLVYLNTKIYQV